MALRIDQPIGDQPCESSGSTGKVCVKGSGASNGGVLAKRVCAKIYQPNSPPSNPSAGPPPDAVCVTPNADATWCIGMVDGAQCSAQPPFPENIVFVWAEFVVSGSSSSSSSASSSGSVFEVASQLFNGKQQASVPQCC